MDIVALQSFVTEVRLAALSAVVASHSMSFCRRSSCFSIDILPNTSLARLLRKCLAGESEAGSYGASCCTLTSRILDHTSYTSESVRYCQLHRAHHPHHRLRKSRVSQDQDIERPPLCRLGFVAASPRSRIRTSIYQNERLVLLLGRCRSRRYYRTLVRER